LALGAYISFSGIMTFKNANDVRAIARDAARPHHRRNRLPISDACALTAANAASRCTSRTCRARCEVEGLEEEEGSALLADNFFASSPRVPRVACMSGTLRVTILGCGSSGGVPRATGDWGVCDPNEPKNRRTRCGLCCRNGAGRDGRRQRRPRVLIDTPPDLRQQLAAAGPSHLDAVLISHDHADQIHGFDDIRAFFIKQRKQIPSLDRRTDARDFMRRFGYAFEQEAAIPAIARDAGHMTPLVPVEIDGARRQARNAAARTGSRLLARSASALGPSHIRTISSTCPRPSRTSMASRSGSSMRCATRRIRRTRTSPSLEWIERLKPSTPC
jgi:ribonuclease BN (tRNA processing enzyme)